LFDIRYSNTSRILSHSLVPLYASPRREDLWVIVNPWWGEGVLSYYLSIKGYDASERVIRWKIM